MAEGQVCEITDTALIDDLTKARFIIPFEPTAVIKEKPKRKGKKT
jgi:hypothetical protein